ncbi:MAG: SMP-30/gluconolactonase/LRE family protein [Ancalomicrobiaceae bacterium]|nr:SMP-30/gluconolactonase/LRE family protein [Ancalomicrobiaceae bacterium]
MREQPVLLASGLAWPESPRWRDGELFISDVHHFRLVKISTDGAVETVCTVEGRPAGMDFAADGSLLLATGVGRELLRIDPSTGARQRVADLGGVAKAFLNDMITHRSGWSWVGDTGFRFGVDDPVANGSLWAYHPDYGVKPAAADIFFPNGMVIGPDDTTLYLVETFGKRISAFDIGEAGALTNRRIHAELPGKADGMCLDADGCLWTAMLFEGAFLRISPAGDVIERIDFPGRNAIACVAAGEDRRTLYLCVCAMDRTDPDNPVRHGEIYTTTLAVPGAGRP